MAGRIANAIAALRGQWPGPQIVEVEKIIEVEVEKAPAETLIQEVIGKAAAVTLYAWSRDTGRKEQKIIPTGLGRPYTYEERVYETVYAHTCEQAHSESSGAAVHAVDCIRVGKSYFRTSEARSIKVLPKPRIG